MDSERETGREGQRHRERQRATDRQRERQTDPDKKRLIRKKKYKKIQSHRKTEREKYTDTQRRRHRVAHKQEQQSEARALTTGHRRAPPATSAHLARAQLLAHPAWPLPTTVLSICLPVRGEKYPIQLPLQLLICLHCCRWEQTGLQTVASTLATFMEFYCMVHREHPPSWGSSPGTPNSREGRQATGDTPLSLR